MIIRGTVHMTDDLDLINKALSDPMNHVNRRKIIVLSLDETSSELEHQYPNNVFTATCLLPPPTAIFHQIDGDEKAFVDDYTFYLLSDVVTDFLSAIFWLLVEGANIMIYTPSFGEDVVWINVLLRFFEMNYGIHIGTSITNNFAYNPYYDVILADLMYTYNTMDVIEYMIYTPDDYTMIPPHIAVKIGYDLRSMVAYGENPVDVFFQLRKLHHTTPNPIKPGIRFGV